MTGSLAELKSLLGLSFEDGGFDDVLEGLVVGVCRARVHRVAPLGRFERRRGRVRPAQSRCLGRALLFLVPVNNNVRVYCG